MSRKIFLDLDGVMADFEKHFADCFDGKEPPSKANGVDDAEMWALVHGHGSFFRTMPWCEGAIDFYRTATIIHGFKFIILTAASKQHYAEMAIQKRDWVREKLPKDLMFLPVWGSSSKTLFMQNPGDILIDDYKKNCDRWEKAGGIAIHHTDNFDETLFQLLEIYRKESLS